MQSRGVKCFVLTEAVETELRGLQRHALEVTGPETDS
jgi:hypothetical protein